MSTPRKRGVLMVCLGNTCRSPIAEAVFWDEVKKRKLTNEWFVDSAGLRDYHVGNGPNVRARELLESKRVEYNHVARVITTQDYSKFDFIFGMDDYNVKEIKRKAPSDSKASIKLFSYYDPVDKSSIRDPYCDSDSKGFQECYKRSVRVVNAFLAQQNVH